MRISVWPCICGEHGGTERGNEMVEKVKRERWDVLI